MKNPLSIALCAVAVVSCADTPSAPDPSAARAATLNGVQMSATGGGHYLLSGALDVKFSFSANQDADGNANGEFRIALEDGDLDYRIQGSVTCMAAESVRETPDGPLVHRAWVGGVIKRIDTNDPALQTEIHQVGRDVWFRVVDAGEGQGAVDRTTFYGFESEAIPSSAAYCAMRIWPAGNARTWPVTEGNISVRP